MAKVNERNFILKILEDINQKNLFVNQVLDDYLFVYEWDKLQRGFVSRVVYGVIENQNYLDFCINQVSKVKVNKMKPTIRYILRMGAYQLMFMDKVPSHAAINEAVKLTNKRNFGQLKGFVNGVLRSIDRERDNFLPELEKLPKNEFLSIRYSINKELVEYLTQFYRLDALENFLVESQKEKKICIRTNTLKTEYDSLLDNLSKECGVEPGHVVTGSMYLENYDQLEKIQAFREGLFQVQDESSMLVGLVANPREDMKILDVCAAPGGKTTHIGELIKDQGQIIACDIVDKKMQRIEENCIRLGIHSVETQKNDATQLNPVWKDYFDIVLSDVPCSGLGILRTKPDIKHNMTINKIKSLIQVQRDILENVKNYVKPGGILVYSTCTINPEENIQQIDYFLKENNQFELVDIEEFIKNMEARYRILLPYVNNKCLQLMTNESLTDGFFIAKLRRKEDVG